MSTAEEEPVCFPPAYDPELMLRIIKEYQEESSLESYQMTACAVCAERIRLKQAHVVSVNRIDFRLLRGDDTFPQDLRPTGYDIDAYQGAFLYPKGMSHPNEMKGTLTMCKSCNRSITRRKKMPAFALANRLYYAHDHLPDHVRMAFERASCIDLRLAARYEANNICFRLQEDPTKTQFYGNPVSGAQRYCRGNVIVLPRDHARLHNLLPPPVSSLRDAFTAVFAGAQPPSQQELTRLRPLLATASVVRTLVEFLVKNSRAYRADLDVPAAMFSPENFQAHFGSDTTQYDTPSFPASLGIGHLEMSNGQWASLDEPSRRNHFVEEDVPSEDILMESCSYAPGESDKGNDREMKARALAQCLSGRPFVLSRKGSQPVPDLHNHTLLGGLLPHLDPYALGGFDHPSRRNPISMSRQLGHLLRRDDMRFQRDAQFAFIFHNIIQKRRAYQDCSFRVSEQRKDTIVRQMAELDAETVERLAAKLKANSSNVPLTDDEKRILGLLQSIQMVRRETPGTNGYKTAKRNEIRGMMTSLGTPTYYITFTPSDLDSPIIRLLTGDYNELPDILRGETFGSKPRRARRVADNPGVSAAVFHDIVDRFIRVVLRYKRGPGLLGTCTGYYGMVEAQGRGTLHIHMLVWVSGQTHPQAMRNRLTVDESWRDRIIEWLERTVKSHLPSQTTVLTKETTGPAPRRSATDVNPCTLNGPWASDFESYEAFRPVMHDFLEDVVSICNWHVHSLGCWSRLRPGEARTDANCRMRMDGETQENSSFDPETGRISLRRLHPWINDYNEVAMFLLKSNMDIQPIMSGDEAKSALFYITDYITKPSLTAHAGLTALALAIKKNRAATDGTTMTSNKVLTRLVNAMMGKQEVSHQQVMSEYVGGGDVYSSHRFRVMQWSVFDRVVRDAQEQAQYVTVETEGITDAPSVRAGVIIEDVTEREAAHHAGGDALVAQGESILTYILQDETDEGQRAREESARLSHWTAEDAAVIESAVTAKIDSAAFWRLVGDADRRGRGSRLVDQSDNVQRVQRARLGPSLEFILEISTTHSSATNQLLDYTCRPQQAEFERLNLYDFVARSRKEKIRREHGTVEAEDNAEEQRVVTELFLPQHPQHATHRLAYSYGSAVVPVILGPTMPRKDTDYAAWCRAMLIVFKPWRVVSDLKPWDEDWEQAYASTDFPANALRIMDNINVLRDCKDVRDRNSAHRADLEPDSVDVDVEDENQPALGASEFDMLDSDEAERTADVEQNVKRVNNEIALHATGLLDSVSCVGDTSMGLELNVPRLDIRSASDTDRVLVRDFAETMTELRKDRRPTLRDMDTSRSFPVGYPSVLPTTEVQTVSALRSGSRSSLQGGETLAAMTPAARVIEHLGMQDNPEQAQVIDTIANHIQNADAKQLLLYVGGMGGTGKSHVIRGIAFLFETMGVPETLRISAPTGAAAIVIGGYTIHALTLLPQPSKRINLGTLEQLWRDVRYLVIDEVSMISAKFMSDISRRLSLAKGGDASSLPFGGINVIFLGDFGQLRPVQGQPVFDGRLTDTAMPSITQSLPGQDALHGAFLWSQVRSVVLLSRNMRQAADVRWANLLERLRDGNAITDLRKQSSSYGRTDAQILETRQLHVVAMHQPEDLERFRNAPIITATKSLRDALNERLSRRHANALKQDIHLLYAVDRIRRKRLHGQQRIDALSISSTTSGDSLGCIPLFIGMRVMVTENVAIAKHIVNGTEGVVCGARLESSDDGTQHAAVVFVYVQGCGRLHPNLPEDVAPIVPVNRHFRWRGVSVTRTQLPLLPAYAYTDYKSQGRSLDRAIVDIASCRSSQSLYVMLSRVRTLNGLLVLRPFPPTKFSLRLTSSTRDEFQRLQTLHSRTRQQFADRTSRHPA